MGGSINHRQNSSPRRTSPQGPTTLLAALVAVVLLFAACSGSDPIDAATDAFDDTVDAVDAVDDGGATVDERSAVLADALRQNGATSLASMVAAVDLDDLTDSTQFTFFAPNDDAFLDMTADETADLLSDPERVLAVLRNHVVADRLEAADVVEMTAVRAQSGTDLPVVVDGESVTIGGATVTATDIDIDIDGDGGGAGIVHVVDEVILP